MTSSLKELGDGWTTIHETLFRNVSIDQIPFRVGESWDFALVLGGVFMDERTKAAISDLALSHGDDPSCVSTTAGQAAMLFHWLELGQLPVEMKFCADLHFFGASATWGIATHIEGVGLLAASHEDVYRYKESLGGDKKLRKDWARNDYGVEVSASGKGEEYRERLSRIVGWA